MAAKIDAETGETRTYRELADESVRCAIWLQKEGIGPGDIIALCTHNSLAAWVPYFATFYIGANLTPWFHDWSPDTTRYIVNLTKPKVIFANEDAGKMLREILREENVESKIIVFGNVPGLESFDDIIKKQSADQVDNFQCHPVNPEDDALMLFSSGSTCFPKGVQHSYRGLHYNTYRFSNLFKKPDNMVVMYTSPLCWIGGSLFTVWSIFSIHQVIIVNNLTTENLCRNVEKFKVQFVFSVTELTKKLFNSYKLMTKFDLSSIKYLIVGGTKLRSEVTKRIKSVLKNAGSDGEIFQSYGLTESGGVIAIQRRGHNKYESCGILSFDIQLKIININTKDILGANQVGEIVIKQTHMMKFYFKNPKATKEVIDDEGWLHTGDLGYYDLEGNIYILDRLKEVIKYRRHQIFPIEIESLLIKHPQVLDAVVVPVPHSVDDEHPMAFVVKAKNSDVSKEELEKLTAVLGDTKQLRGGIVFIEKLPQTPNRKINKMKLKEMAKAYHDSSSPQSSFV
ncbi:4-coumarate--CoA ligase 1-like [Belonocnema kinseyi]|uniref:4-coumarate--CoA ligase 1-like n=1 Tax=Belonocnema kinseyi TaxID=2817044 RepID=UPI00143D2C63|nr:4-coumarate--CoA ligase 1-like [Belonocnema kinseyi]